MRFVFGGMVVAAMLVGAMGCSGPTDKQKEEAEKIPKLDIEESGEMTEEKEGEAKDKKDAEAAKP